jgi:A/G-specific adenine glycosylase
MAATYSVPEILDYLSVHTLRNDLLCWWRHGRRSFPWRETRDPYKVLVAEVLLHRTRADQVVPLYELLLVRFPDVQALAKSRPDELLRLLHSAGLQWRWKLLHAMSVELEARFNGQIPEDSAQLISLPGVSHYIASAVRCFAFGYPDAILDTNTVRVTGRLLGLVTTDSSRRSRLFRDILQSLIDPDNPRDFNFALIDFAATICTAKSPLHLECPLRGHCHFSQQMTCKTSTADIKANRKEASKTWTGSSSSSI